jgi:DUF4097 and DUF4098 domain-containing protein YvlB
MKKIAYTMIVLATILYGQEPPVDRVTVDLTDPAKPAHLELGLINGGVRVTGYGGQQVIVEAKTSTGRISSEDRHEKNTGYSKEKNKEGMFRIPVYSTSLEVEENNNKIMISTESWKRSIDVDIKVPRQTSLNLSCINNGDIEVENVNGDIEVNNINGDVTLLHVTGSAVAHALNGDLRVTFDAVDPKKPMSFSSMNGDIDVTFPATLKCDTKIKNDQGDVYSDFEITRVDKPVNRVEENERGKDGAYRVRIERTFYGSIGGGGPEYTFSNFNGDVLIRKAK